MEITNFGESKYKGTVEHSGPSIKEIAEAIAKKWDVYYLPSGEVNNNVLEAIKEAIKKF